MVASFKLQQQSGTLVCVYIYIYLLVYIYMYHTFLPYRIFIESRHSRVTMKSNFTHFFSILFLMPIYSVSIDIFVLNEKIKENIEKKTLPVLPKYIITPKSVGFILFNHFYYYIILIRFLKRKFFYLQ